MCKIIRLRSHRFIRRLGGELRIGLIPIYLIEIGEAPSAWLLLLLRNSRMSTAI